MKKLLAILTICLAASFVYAGAVDEYTENSTPDPDADRILCVDSFASDPGWSVNACTIPELLALAAGDFLADGSVPMTGEITIDNLGAEFTAGDDHSNCSAFSATGGGIFFDDSEGIFKKCQDNVLTDLDTGGSGDVSADEIWDAAGDLVYGTGADTAARLAAGATTEILVGGGAAAPVWTTATGTGAPVRAGDPAFTGDPTLTDVDPTITVNDTTEGEGAVDIHFQTPGAYDMVATFSIDVAGVKTTALTLDGSSGTGRLEMNLPLYGAGNAEFDTLTADITVVTPQALSVTTEDDVTVGTELTSSVVMLTGDDDADHDTLTLQNGVTDGTILTFIVAATCDDSDTLIIDAETDSTCTGCPDSGIFTFDDPGDKLTLYWNATNPTSWFYVGSYAVD